MFDVMTTGPQVTKEDIQSRLDPFGSTLTDFKQPLRENKIRFICVCGEPVEKFMEHVQRFVGLCTPCSIKRGRENKIQTEHSGMLEKVQAKLEEDGATLVAFPPASLKRQKIAYSCSCGKNYSKNWDMMTLYGAFCDECTLKNGLSKKEETVQKNWGVRSVNQSPVIRSKSKKTAFSTKSYISPNGTEFWIQGYENFAFDRIFNIGYNGIPVSEDDIQENVPEVWYTTTDGIRHRYFTDIFIPKLNLCIEVKSTYTMELGREVNMLKQKATRNAGYNHVIWIFSRKGELVETVT